MADVGAVALVFDPMPLTRSYEQLCPVAIGLDVLESRWSLLLLRDLLWHGPHSFQKLKEANPGISASMLSGRLRDLAAAGLVERDPHEPKNYRLSARGRGIKPVIDAIYAFGAALLPEAPLTEDKLRYLVQLAAKLSATKLAAVEQDASVRLTVDDIRVDVAVGPSHMSTFGETRARRAAPDTEVRLSGDELIGILSHSLTIDDLPRRRIRGDREAARTLLTLLTPPGP
ncbi:MAG: helix-turn-helix domain-containing protein [Myxococcota bacterium]